VNFVHRPADGEEFARVLRCPVTADAAWNGLAISPDTFRLGLKRRDAVLRGVLEGVAIVHDNSPAERSVVGDVRRALASRVTGGDTRIQSVARHIGMTARTLQRRLAALNLSYNEVLDTLRREAAEQYLAGDTLSVGEIAYLLGYSEPAAFHRAFRRWHQVTPAAFRKEGRVEVGPVPMRG
jgi:AraC-like DNA-binding protein